uniref:Uncharacterized protein n=1 Tax=Physcomitrium patens TaxID=3218 RepID=A9REP2_PHYPA|nr:hypothetical protein PHYPA_021462 [Physcomitrium patens]
MEQQLQQAREWRSAQASQQALIQVGPFLYDGWEQDDPSIHPLIFEFLHNAHWFVHSRVVDRRVDGLMLKKTNSGAYWTKDGVYEDRVGGARHFIQEYGAHWRNHVQSIA